MNNCKYLVFDNWARYWVNVYLILNILFLIWVSFYNQVKYLIKIIFSIRIEISLFDSRWKFIICSIPVYYKLSILKLTARVLLLLWSVSPSSLEMIIEPEPSSSLASGATMFSAFLSTASSSSFTVIFWVFTASATWPK